MRKHIGLLATAGLAIALPSVSMAAGPTLSDVLVNTGITVNGYVDGSYVYGFNKGSTLVGRAFDSKSDSFIFNQAALSVGYLPTEGFGAFVNVIGGEDAKVINSSYNANNSGSDFAFTQAYFQYATGNFTVIGGRFVTLAGFEVIDDTKNSNLSRSYLFQLAEPLVLTGVRASYKFSDMITAYLGVDNTAVAGLSDDTNKQKTLEFGALVTPTKAISVGIYDYYGLDGSPASEGGVTTKDNYLDFVAAYQLTDALQLALNADYLRSLTKGDPGAAFYASGIAGYANYTFSTKIKGSLRGEFIKGAQDGQPGTNLHDITLTVDYSPASSFDILGEVRVDGAGSEPFYPNGDSLKNTDGDVSIKAIYKFGTPAPSA